MSKWKSKTAKNSSIFVAKTEKKKQAYYIIYCPLYDCWKFDEFELVSLRLFLTVKNQHLMTVPLKRWRWQFVPMKDESAPCGRAHSAATKKQTLFTHLPCAHRILPQISHSHAHTHIHIVLHTLTNHIQIDCQNNKRPNFSYDYHSIF